jgi:DNA-binding MarR family transcriptional regulator
MRDARDHRRTLVWLTDEGRAAMAAEQQVLCLDRLERALARLDPEQREALLAGLRELIEGCDEPKATPAPRPQRRRSETKKRRSL